jgi:hypothetical protein
MTTLRLLFEGDVYEVPKKSVLEFLKRRNLLNAQLYAVESLVPQKVFEEFVVSLQTETKPSVAADTAASLSLLAAEFCLPKLEHECSRLSAIASPSSQPVKEHDFPMKEEESLDGIIAYLTQKHGGNVHEKGIVILTSKSVFTDDPNARNCTLPALVDLQSRPWFVSKGKPNQWVCWDFREMRVRLTSYTVQGFYLNSWNLEGSVDGKDWTEIDQQRGAFLKDMVKGSYTLACPAECRFIRLTQVGENIMNGLNLGMRAVEFFGTLLE